MRKDYFQTSIRDLIHVIMLKTKQSTTKFTTRKHKAKQKFKAQRKAVIAN